MARPTKQGIDYFPLDCVFDDDLQLFITENGADSLGILVVVWQMIYQNDGYYIVYDKKLPLKVKQRILSDVGRIKDVINEAVKWGIFNESVFNKHKILTSSGIQKRYLIGSRSKKEVLIYTDLMLIDVSGVGNAVNVAGNPEKSAGNATNVKVNGKPSHFTPPTKTQFTEYMIEKSYRFDPDIFLDHYQSNNWMVGKNKMKDWKAAARNWSRRDSNSGYSSVQQRSAPQTKELKP